jgi:hypothetical protein
VEQGSERTKVHMGKLLPLHFPSKPPVPNLCHWQFNACHVGSYFIHSMPCRTNLHPSILSSCLSHVKQHVFLCPISCLPEIEHPTRIDGILPASAHVKSPSLWRFGPMGKTIVTNEKFPGTFPVRGVGNVPLLPLQYLYIFIYICYILSNILPIYYPYTIPCTISIYVYIFI